MRNLDRRPGGHLIPTHVSWDGCGLVLLALESLDPGSIGRDECSDCGGTDFSFLEGDG